MSFFIKKINLKNFILSVFILVMILLFLINSWLVDALRTSVTKTAKSYKTFIEGIVTDGSTGLSISNATVQIVNSSYSTSTNLLGNYDLASLQDGNVQVQFSAPGYIPVLLNFWKNNVGVSGHKLTLGVPFYGYDFVNSSNANSFTYGSMVELNNSNSEIDNLGNKYYNGRPTITRKVRLAAQNLSGIMIWELGQDSFTDYSLLKTIHKTYHDLGVKTTGLCTN